MIASVIRRRNIVAISCALLGVAIGPTLLRAQIQVAGDLFVELDAGHASAGTAAWTNTASAGIGNFIVPLDILGDPGPTPIVEVLDGMPGVTFNSTGDLDVYQCENDTPEGLVGADPTRSIEAWVYNTAPLVIEETILSWGRRGGPAGTNMSFNYGTHPAYGAVGHWDAPDIGWNEAGGAPSAGRWHHMVYTYDGTTTRVYADGCLVDVNNCEQNSEVLGAGIINTYPEQRILLAAQYEPDGVTINFGLRGTLSLGRVRIHDDVLTAAQVKNNFDEECPQFCPPPGTCTCENCPTTDLHVKGKAVYTRQLKFSGFPPPTGFSVPSPAGATISPTGLLQYTLPNPQIASFNVTVACTNSEGTANFAWTVSLVDPPARAAIDIAGELFVELCASHDTAGEDLWLNSGTTADFFQIGDPVLEAVGPNGNPAVSFNLTGATDDSYQGFENAPAGLVGPNPTRSIEAWVFNAEVPDEETIVSWGRRGGPDGSNMSFNYGVHPAYGAVGHWGGAGPDLGWNNAGGAPAAGEWHHLVYTFDGDATATTRVYADGVLQNSELLGAGVINTFPEHPITLAVQIADAAGTLAFGPLEGTLSIGKLRVHDGVLSAAQVFKNFNAEREAYGLPEPPVLPPEFTNAPDADSFCETETSYAFSLQFTGVPPPSLEITSPPGATITQTGLITYAIPQPPAASFNVVVKATNAGGEATASWTVTRESTAPTLEVAEELIVDLDARDPSAGTDLWSNAGTLGDFEKLGNPQLTTKGTIRALSFNEENRSGDAYRSLEDVPEGVVGVDPTRSVEVWVWNDVIDVEETLVAWGKRGGPDGSNVSINYGSNAAYGAVGHWGAPDIGWGPQPPAGAWNHLVYTYDGNTTTTRVYQNGVETNSEVLAAGVINTFTPTKMVVADQILPDGIGITNDANLRGELAIARIRVHDGVLTACQINSNYNLEKDDFTPAPCPQPGDLDFADTRCTGITVEEIRPGIITHRVTATATDASGDIIRYSFTATDGTTVRNVGPQGSPVANFSFRTPAGPMVFTVTVDDRADCDDVAADATCKFPPDGPVGTPFHRGDADNNAQLQLTDAVRILGVLFLGTGVIPCMDAGDADDNGQLQLTDAVRILGVLFLGTGVIPPPGPTSEPCGLDPTEDELGCEEYTGC